ncbi:MAG: preprotein translocase subunit SecE [Clostridia bacterium]
MAKETKNKKHFFKDFKAELKKVIWPTPKQLINSTIAVIVIVLITSAIVFVLDLAFDGMNNYGINKMKAKLVNETSEVSEAIVDNTVENEIREESTAE